MKFAGHYDRILLVTTIALLAIGLLMVASASIVIAQRQFDAPFHYLIRQLIHLAVGCVCGFLVLRTPIGTWQQWSTLLLLCCFLLLIAVLIPGLGISVNGSARWIGVGPLRLQVSELTKLFFIIYLSGYLVRHEYEVRKELSGFIKPLFLLGMIAFLLLLEPDFGATVVLLLTTMSLLFLAGVPLRQFFIVMLMAGLLIAVLAISSPYRLARLTTFLNPWAHPFAGGYQLTQALIAFGRGGWFGVGLGESIQKLFYLPEAHTDFLFAVLVEELGLAGALVVLGLFVLLVIRIVVIARRAHAADHFFAAYLAYGSAFWLGLQAFINLGVNSGVLPTKGLTLPLMSYGGSSMIVNCIVIAMLLRIDYELRSQRKR